MLSPSRRQQKTAAKPPQAHRETFLSGGDLMVIASPYWDRPYLGIVQPWDPDYDVKFGINFQSNPQIQQHTLAEAIAQSENTGEIATINVLVCVDSLEQSSMSSHGDIPGGWVAPGSIYPGVCFHMSLLGNVMTYLRECQALMSVKLLNSRLQQAIINPEGRSKVSYVTDHHLHDDPGPTNVPFRLWDALRRSHNDSQLRALRMICKRHSEADVPASPICLLQGPPGTGKTKTILGVLSVCLSGALKPMSKATKVVPGSSFNSAEVKRLRSDSFSLNGDAGSFKAGRPRILVCAPSNTAVDELVFRILTQGLLGPDGLRIDDLSVVRIGHTMKDEYLQRVKSHVFVRKVWHLFPICRYTFALLILFVLKYRRSSLDMDFLSKRIRFSVLWSE